MHDIRHLQHLRVISIHQRHNRSIPEFKLDASEQARGGKELGVEQRTHGVRSSHKSSRPCHHQVAVGDCYAELPLGFGLQLGHWPWQSGIALIFFLSRRHSRVMAVFLKLPKSVSFFIPPKPNSTGLACHAAGTFLFQCDIRLVGSKCRVCSIADIPLPTRRAQYPLPLSLSIRRSYRPRPPPGLLFERLTLHWPNSLYYYCHRQPQKHMVDRLDLCIALIVNVSLIWK
jgi:hypothetical protein